MKHPTLRPPLAVFRWLCVLLSHKWVVVVEGGCPRVDEGHVLHVELHHPRKQQKVEYIDDADNPSQPRSKNA